MRKLIRRFKFYFLWKIAMKAASNAVNRNPMMFPHFMTLNFSRDRMLQYYLANYTFSEGIDEIFKEQETAFKRKDYKRKKREEMLMAMDADEYTIYIDRVAKWEDWNDFSEARAQFTNSN